MCLAFDWKEFIWIQVQFQEAVDYDGSVYMGTIESITTVLSALEYRLVRITVFSVCGFGPVWDKQSKQSLGPIFHYNALNSSNQDLHNTRAKKRHDRSTTTTLITGYYGTINSASDPGGVHD